MGEEGVGGGGEKMLAAVCWKHCMVTVSVAPAGQLPVERLDSHTCTASLSYSTYAKVEEVRSHFHTVTPLPMSIKPMWTGAGGLRVRRGMGQDWAFPCLMVWLIINPLSNYEMVKTNEISATRLLMSALPIPLTLCLCHTNDNICMCRVPWRLHNTWIWNFVFCTLCSR